MTLNSSGGIVGYDDYYPFGMQMPNRSSVSSAEFRYRFTGKERDVNETGWDYFGARYYDSRIGRWLGVDPLADKYPGWSVYNYTMDNPVRLVDPNGKEPLPPNEEDVNAGSIILSAFFDTKHAIENLLVNVIKDSPEGMKWKADYAKDEYGNEIFKTEIKLVPSEGFTKDAVGYSLDALTIAGAGRGGDAGSLLAKGPGKNQATQAVKDALSPNQMNKAIEKGLAPNGITRVDLGKVKGEQIHAHFGKDAALNKDGTWKHGKADLTNKQKEWLKDNGWKLPENR